jgi:Type VI secretion system/phage-baseplate injector OB domain
MQEGDYSMNVTAEQLRAIQLTLDPDLEPEPDPKRFYGVTTGKVINPIDPMFLGRVQVQLPFIDPLDLSPWARVATPMTGIFSGFYCLPNLGDEVLVAFEQGDVNVPYIIGTLWNVGHLPPLPSPVPQIRCIRSPVGNQVVFTEVPPTLTLQNAPTPPVAIPAPPVAAPPGPEAYQTIALTSAGIVMTTSTFTVVASTAISFEVGGNIVTMTPGGVAIASAGALNLGAPTGAVNIIAGTTMTLTAPLVTINP